MRELRRWLGPLGRYRPGFLRRDMAHGFHNCDRRSLPYWARVVRWQSAEERLLDGLDYRGRVVYDVGAYRGSYCLFFSQRVGAAGRVVAFEPSPGSFGILLKNLRKNEVRNVLPLRMALGAEHGQATIYALPGMPTTASLSLEARTPLRKEAGRAQIERLDDVLSLAALPPPDFIKVDVEGFELDVLKGALHTLADHQPELLIEVHGTGWREKAERVRDIAALLMPLGYDILHAESGQVIQAAARPVTSGHLYARAAA